MPALIFSCLLLPGCSGVGGGQGEIDQGINDIPTVLKDLNDPKDPGGEPTLTDLPVDETGTDLQEAGCIPACDGKDCGDDGCGGICGTCPDNGICEEGVCQCEFAECNLGCCEEGKVCWMGGCCLPVCEGKDCGDDGCGGADACGVCPAGQTCHLYQCCLPDCDGKECGPDGCGGLCGDCTGDSLCVDGTCCLPDCDGKECGDDGCGATCGTCILNMICDGGTCVDDPGWVGCSDGTREGFIHVADYPLIAGCSGAWDVPGIHNEDPACDRKAGNTGENAEGKGCNVTDLCPVGWHVCLGKLDVLYRSTKGCQGIMDGALSPAFFLTRTSSTGAFNCAPDAIGDITTVNDIFGCGDLGCPMSQGKCGDGKGCIPGVQCKDCAQDKECVDGTDCTPDICYPLSLSSHDGCKALRNKPTSSCKCYFLGELDPDDPSYVDGDMTTVKCTPSSGGCGWCKPLDYWNKKLGITFADTWDCGGAGSTEAADVVKGDPYAQGGVLCCKDQCEIDAECGDGMECIMSTCQIISP